LLLELFFYFSSNIKHPPSILTFRSCLKIPSSFILKAVYTTSYAAICQVLCPLRLQLHTYYKSHLGYYRLLPCRMSVFPHCVLMQECHKFYKKYFSLLKYFLFSKHMSNKFLIFLQFQTFCKFIFYSSVITVKVYLSGPLFSDNFYLMANFSHTDPCNFHLSQFSQYLQFTEQYLTIIFLERSKCYTITFYCLKCLVNTIFLSCHFPFFITVHNKTAVCERPFY